MVVSSAAAYGTLAILAKLAYAQGLGTVQLLAYRFAAAALGMIALSVVLGQNPLRISRRRLLALLTLGTLIYTVQALSFFLALRTLSASLVILITYIYPSLVVLTGWLVLRRAASLRLVIGLVASFFGLAMLVGAAHVEFTSGLGFALLSPVLNTVYILISEWIMVEVPPVGASAVIICSAAAVFCSFAALTGQILPAPSYSGLIVAVTVGLVTMLALSLFLAGLPRIGAVKAALLGTLEPVVTIFLAVELFGDRLSIPQAIGGLLVLMALVVINRERATIHGSHAAL